MKRDSCDQPNEIQWIHLAMNTINGFLMSIALLNLSSIIGMLCFFFVFFSQEIENNKL